LSIRRHTRDRKTGKSSLRDLGGAEKGSLKETYVQWWLLGKRLPGSNKKFGNSRADRNLGRKHVRGCSVGDVIPSVQPQLCSVRFHFGGGGVNVKKTARGHGSSRGGATVLGRLC